MGGRNPIQNVIRNSPAVYLTNELSGASSDARRSETQLNAAKADAARASAKAAEDQLTANNSVAMQKEKQRKQTVFAGAGSANLFNKSLLGTSTTAASGNSRSILGA